MLGSQALAQFAGQPTAPPPHARHGDDDDDNDNGNDAPLAPARPAAAYPYPKPTVHKVVYRKFTEPHPSEHTVAVFPVNRSYGTQRVQWLPFDPQPWLERQVRAKETKRGEGVDGDGPARARARRAQGIQKQLAAAPGASDNDLWWARIFDQPGPQMGTAACARQRESCITGTEAATLVGDNPWSARDAAADDFKDTREWLLARKTGRVPSDKPANANMKRGQDEEQEAGELFEALTGIELAKEPIGFIRHPDGLVGASPDRRCKWVPLLIEIKSKRDTFKFIPEINYWWQVQQQMYVTGIHNCVLLQYISAKEFAGARIPAVCMHLIQFDEASYDAYLRDYAAPFAIDLARRRGVAPPPAALRLVRGGGGGGAARPAGTQAPVAGHTAAAAAAAASVPVSSAAGVCAKEMAAFAPNTGVAGPGAASAATRRPAPPSWIMSRESAAARAVAEAALAAAGGLTGVEAAAAVAAAAPKAPRKPRAPAGSAYAGLPPGTHFNGQPPVKKPRKPRALPKTSKAGLATADELQQLNDAASAAIAAVTAAAARAAAAVAPAAPRPVPPAAATRMATGVRAIPKTPKALARRRADTDERARMQAGVAAMQAAMMLFAPPPPSQPATTSAAKAKRPRKAAE